MTEKEFNKHLDDFRLFLDPTRGVITDNKHPDVLSFISFYQKLTGEKIGEGTCKNCILDAFFKLKTLTPNQLKNLLMEKKYKLKPGAKGGPRLVGFGGDHYSNVNINDAIAFEMIRSNRSNAGAFENPEQLLQDYDLSISKPVSLPDVKKPVEEKKEVTAPVKDADNLTVSVTEKTEDKPAAEKKKGKKKK